MYKQNSTSYSLDRKLAENNFYHYKFQFPNSENENKTYELGIKLLQAYGFIPANNDQYDTSKLIEEYNNIFKNNSVSTYDPLELQLSLINLINPYNKPMFNLQMGKPNPNLIKNYALPEKGKQSISKEAKTSNAKTKSSK